MGPAGIVGILLQLSAVFSAVLLYRTSKYGLYMQAAPYILSTAGGALLFIEPKIADPLTSSLVLPAITIIVHAVILRDMRKSRQPERRHKLK